MKLWLRNALVYLATGYVLFFASERLFWSTFRPGDHAGDFAVTWLAYSVLACVFLNVVSRLRATTTATVFLAGALYGWMTEGVLVGTLYGTEGSAPFPMSLVWTGLSWHALISVLVCWHFLGRALRKPAPWTALAWAVGVGLYWGAWAPFLWHETPPQVATIHAFAIHATGCTLLWMLSYAILLRLSPDGFSPGLPGLGLSLLVLAVFYVAQVKALGLRPLLVLPALAGLILGLLVWSRRHQPGTADPNDGTDPTVARPVRGLPLLTLLATPVAAVALYSLQKTLHLNGIAPIHFFNAGGILSVGILGWAMYCAFRAPSRPNPSDPLVR